MPRYQLRDDTGTVFYEADDPADLVWIPQEDAEEILAALRTLEDEGKAVIGGGAAPTFWLIDTELYENA